MLTKQDNNESLTLTKEQKEQYLQEGYLHVKGLIPRELVEPIRETLVGFEHGHNGWPAEKHFRVLDPNKYSTKEGQPIPVGVQSPANHSDAFRQVAHHPRLRGVMQELLGKPVELHTDQALLKWGWLEEDQGGRSYFHQDSFYWKLAPKVGSNCWIPLDSVGPNAIALAVMPGSHRDWTLVEHESYYDEPAYYPYGSDKPYKRLRIPDSTVDYSKEVLISMEPGDGLFFTNYTWHRSEPNRTGETKIAYPVSYRVSE